MRLYTARCGSCRQRRTGECRHLSVLVDWVENNRAPGDLTVVEQQPVLPIAVDRALPLCQWAGLAALQGRRFQKCRELRLRAMMQTVDCLAIYCGQSEVSPREIRELAECPGHR
jgi:hypothetical protein